MITISIQTIALIIIFFYNQSIFTMMISHSFSIKRCNEVQNLLAYKIKHSQSFQKVYKNSFIDKWMYKFDGKSSERLRKVLIEDEAV